MNQASRASEVVPVLPATCRPSSRARAPVPLSTTLDIIQISCCAAFSEITRSPMPPAGPMIVSVWSLILSSRKPNGVTEDPPFRMPA